jgi:hypothetical protein
MSLKELLRMIYRLASDNAYVTGVTYSPNLPTANALQPAPANPDANAFVAKISP